MAANKKPQDESAALEQDAFAGVEVKLVRFVRCNGSWHKPGDVINVTEAICEDLASQSAIQLTEENDE